MCTSHQISRIVEMVGYPPEFMLDNGKDTAKFFRSVSSDNSSSSSSNANISGAPQQQQQAASLAGSIRPAGRGASGAPTYVINPTGTIISEIEIQAASTYVISPTGDCMSRIHHQSEDKSHDCSECL